MGEPTLATREREELCDLLVQVGPDAPTLCPGWATRDLAAHLIIREGRPDAAPGILLPVLSGYSRRVQAATAARPWPDLVERIRGGPPWYSPLRLGPAAQMNGVEFFVHHEDVRRARPGWSPRSADSDRAEELWRLLVRVGRFCYRKSPVGVVARLPGGTERTLRVGTPAVTVIGRPEELVLHAYGREQAVVEFEGAQPDIELLRACPRGF